MKSIRRAGLLALLALAILTKAGGVAAATDCSVTVTAGGLGGGGYQSGSYSLSLGWGVSISNANGSAPCSVSVSPSESGLTAYSGPSYTAAAGSSFGEGPSKWINTSSIPYGVSISASSVSCPAGNSPVASGGSTASCSLSLGACSVDGYGNTICQVNGCQDSRTITCPSVPKAPSVSLSANPTKVPWYGGSVSLSWSVSDATSCTASGDWSGSQDASNGSHSGSVTIYPLTGDHTYSLTCTGPGGSKTSSATVTMGKNSAPSVSVTSPSSGAQITKGSSVSIEASASDSDGTIASVEFFVDSSSVGSDSSSPYTASWSASSVGGHTVTAIATDNAGATSQDSVSFTVSTPVVVQGPSVSLSASPSNVSWWTGGDVALAWSVSGATSCAASGSWSGSKDAGDGSHAETVSIGSFSSPKTYSISCTGPGGSASDSVTVNVGNNDLCADIPGEQTSVPAGHTRDSNGNCPLTQVAAPSVSLSASPSSISSPQSVDLSWTSSRANSCTASGGWNGAKSTSGSQSVSVSATASFTLTCSGDGGQGSDTATITLNTGGSGGAGGGTGGSSGGSGGGSNPQPGFTVASKEGNRAAVQFLSGLGGTSDPRTIEINPVGGFTDPITLSASGGSLPASTTVSYAFDGNPTAVLSWDPSFSGGLGGYLSAGHLGSVFKATFSKAISAPYDVTIRGVSSGGTVSLYTLTIFPDTKKPSFQEI